MSQVYYNNDSVYVDSTRYKVEGTTYPINGITSVSAEKYEKPTRHISGFILTVLGIIFFLLSYRYNLFFIIIGLLFFLPGLARLMDNPNATYSVKILTAAGEHNTLMSENEPMISDIIEAINQAIIARG